MIVFATTMIAAITTATFAAETAPQCPVVKPVAASSMIMTPDSADALFSIEQARTSHPGPLLLSQDEIHRLRVKKCEYLVSRLYPKSGFLPHVEYFISEHERRGMGDEWLWSLSYGGANCSLRCNVRFRNGCAGPMDRPGGSTNPRNNIRAHCNELHGFYRRGFRGYAAMKRVFYPARPHDWGGGRIWKRYQLHRNKIDEGYGRGLLP
jgi:hypothetical protein